MATTLYTTWYDEVLPELTGAVSQAMVLNAIKQAAIEFFARSWVWIVDQGPMAVAQGVNDYTWKPPTGAEAARPMQVWLAKQSLTPKTANELSALYGDFMRAEGSPVYFCQDRPDTLIVVPKPVGVYTDGLTAKLAVKPTQAATGCETVYANRYRDAITYGAKLRLFRMPKKPWTDKELAGYYQGEFDKAIGSAQLDAVRGHAGARARVKPMYF